MRVKVPRQEGMGSRRALCHGAGDETESRQRKRKHSFLASTEKNLERFQEAGSVGDG